MEAGAVRVPYQVADIDLVARWLRARAQRLAEARTGHSLAPCRVLSWSVAQDLAVGVLRMLDKADDAAWNAWRAGLDYVRSRTVEDA